VATSSSRIPAANQVSATETLVAAAQPRHPMKP
jgi:hypothetical protein